MWGFIIFAIIVNHVSGRCLDPSSNPVGFICEDIVTYVYWSPNDSAVASQYAISTMVGSALVREITCALAFPVCGPNGEPLRICSSDCGRWQGRPCERFPSTSSSLCTHFGPRSIPPASASIVTFSFWLFIVYLLVVFIL